MKIDNCRQGPASDGVIDHFCREMNSMVLDCIEKGDLPYVFSHPAIALDTDVITGLHLTGINSHRIILKGNRIGAQDNCWISGADAAAMGFILRSAFQDSSAAAASISPGFDCSPVCITGFRQPEGGRAEPDAKFVYLVSQFAPETVSRAMNMNSFLDCLDEISSLKSPASKAESLLISSIIDGKPPYADVCKSFGLDGDRLRPFFESAKRQLSDFFSSSFTVPEISQAAALVHSYYNGLLAGSMSGSVYKKEIRDNNVALRSNISSEHLKDAVLSWSDRIGRSLDGNTYSDDVSRSASVVFSAASAAVLKSLAGTYLRDSSGPLSLHPDDEVYGSFYSLASSGDVRLLSRTIQAADFCSRTVVDPALSAGRRTAIEAKIDRCIESYAALSAGASLESGTGIAATIRQKDYDYVSRS